MEPVKPFSNLHHLSLVVRDMDTAVRFLESLGIGPFTEYPPMEEYTRLNVPDREGFFDSQSPDPLGSLPTLVLSLCAKGVRL